ncbi:hypothetical protein [Pseudosporangium ferrugineum]|uniref:Uncharacterized protein n=1 Tax=Pseudosporangium ferrugineum TaxID=439699 RepID=A0A2T0RSG3_9ACTN|nr:hypothetical protein [Pseudosporangium ferrugineum]PRY24050.1 hypothetical protein CLV70_114183 [Pseudosporangium ferrugineum]
MSGQRFLNRDGTAADRLTPDMPMIAPDAFNAVRLLIAVLDGDVAEVERIASDFPAMPLLGGVISLALMLGDQATDGDRAILRRILDQLALIPELDAAGTAEAYRARRTA